MAAPQNNAVVQGIGAVGADNLNTYVQWTTSTAVLRTFIGLPNMAVFLEGIAVPDDGGGGLFIWEASVSQADDNHNYIIPPGASGGGWVRIDGIYPLPIITGALSSVTDSNAKAVLTSIILALVAQNIATQGTT